MWGFRTNKPEIPPPDELAATIRLVGFEKVHVDDSKSTIFIDQKGTAINVTEAARGYAAEAAARILTVAGVKAAIVNTGGDILTVGKKPDGSLWRVGIQNPWSPPGSYIGIVELSGGCVGTAGTYTSSFQVHGATYNKFIDPHTGYPAKTGVVSAAHRAGVQNTRTIGTNSIVAITSVPVRGECRNGTT